MEHPELSIIVIVYNMRREARRTLISLALPYQRDVMAEQYEVIVVENGSTDPLSSEEVMSNGKNFQYHFLENPPPSPAFAINFGLSRAKGKYVSIMVDGAHMATPGLVYYAIAACCSVDKPVVLSQRFHLGSGPQPETIINGYNKPVEDELLVQIDWPSDGYRLYEISYPLIVLREKQKTLWYARMFESNFLVMRRDMLLQIGGCDEQFDIPGGGFLIPDLYRRAVDEQGVKIIYLIGEATFHQIHGGVSTGGTIEDQQEQLVLYKDQYQKIRGCEYAIPKNPLNFFGHIPNKVVRSQLLPVDD